MDSIRTLFSCIRIRFQVLCATTLVFISTFALSEHLDDLKCSRCHQFDAPSQTNSQLLVASQQQICLTCHSGLEFSSHPVDFHTLKDMPPDFPLANNDVFACSTCHEIHSPELHGKIRANPDLDFCALCHDGQFFSQMTQYGQYFKNRVHLVTFPQYEPLDSYSFLCLDCHADKFELNGTNKRHSIGKNFESTSGLSSLQSIDLLPYQFALPGGQMSCITCHESYSVYHGELVWDLSESALCMQCHLM